MGFIPYLKDHSIFGFCKEELIVNHALEHGSGFNVASIIAENFEMKFLGL